MLAHQLLPHFDTVICRIITYGIGRIRLVVESATVGGKITVSVNYNSVGRISRNNATCPV